MRIHIVDKYNSFAMQRMVNPLLEGLLEIGEVTRSAEFDPEADLNYHIPWHFLVDQEIGDEWEKIKNAIMYTHCSDRYIESLGLACHRADIVFAMSHKGKKELLDIGVPAEKIWVTYCGSNHVSWRKKNIGVVATIQPDGRKRTHILYDLVWQMDKDLRKMINFILVGVGWEEIGERIKKAGASVTFAGPVTGDDLYQYYQSMDMMITPGYIEGGPLTVLEGLRSGVSVYAADTGYANDFLEDKYIFRNAEELIEKVESQLRPVKERMDLGNMFTWQQWAADHNLVLGRLLKADFDPKFFLATGRYAQLLDVIDEVKPESICEVGTWNGYRGLQMIQQAQKHNKNISYTGYDLFEEMDAYTMAKEVSKWSPSLKAVGTLMKPVGAKIELIAGNTKITLNNHTPSADFYFIDGGHSEETIANDWKCVSESMKKDSVVIFDDYYLNKDDAGCKRLVDSLDPKKWDVEILPHKTEAQYADKGLLEIAMVKVKYA